MRRDMVYAHFFALPAHKLLLFFRVVEQVLYVKV
jgi:hypothetical protein